jgi:hypothetical protein
MDHYCTDSIASCFGITFSFVWTFHREFKVCWLFKNKAILSQLIRLAIFYLTLHVKETVSRKSVWDYDLGY